MLALKGINQKRVFPMLISIHVLCICPKALYQYGPRVTINIQFEFTLPQDVCIVSLQIVALSQKVRSSMD